MLKRKPKGVLKGTLEGIPKFIREGKLQGLLNRQTLWFTVASFWPCVWLLFLTFMGKPKGKSRLLISAGVRGQKRCLPVCVVFCVPLLLTQCNPIEEISGREKNDSIFQYLAMFSSTKGSAPFVTNTTKDKAEKKITASSVHFRSMNTHFF